MDSEIKSFFDMIDEYIIPALTKVVKEENGKQDREIDGLTVRIKDIENKYDMLKQMVIEKYTNKIKEND